MIDPEFWSDEEIGTWSYAARLFYIALWNFSDDEGRFKAHDALLKAQIFPYDDRIDIQKLKIELSNKVQWYEVGQLKYGYLRNFLKHQSLDRPSKSMLPEPPPFDEPSTNTLRDLAQKGIEEKRKEEKRRAIAHLTDEEFIKALKANPAYKGINIDIELSKMDAWFLTPKGKNRIKTRGFVVNWLNKIEKPIGGSHDSAVERIKRLAEAANSVR